MTASVPVSHERDPVSGERAITTVVTRVRDRAGSGPHGVAMREKDRGIWHEVSWDQYWDRVQLVGHALLALGIEPGDRVAIQAENRQEWLYGDLGTMAVRATTVGLYPTNPAAEVGYVLTDSGARVLVAEDQEQVDKALAVPESPLERIVYIEPRGIEHHYDDPRLMSWDALLELGERHRAAHPDAVDRTMAATRPDDVATLVYTSGTTGPPKGAMLTVANIEFAVSVVCGGGGFPEPPPSGRDVTLSYLPLCHVAERAFTVWLGTSAGVQVHFAESTETVPANLREIQPTLLFGVPRIWEKVLAGINIRIQSATWFKRTLARTGLALADQIGRTLVRTGGRHTLGTRIRYAVGWLFLFRALRDRIGMRRVRYAASGAAPIAPEVLRFFMGIGIPMHEIYGMTENSGMATGNRFGRVRVGTVGEPHPGVELRIDDQTGEILTRSPGGFAGYWNNPEASRRALDPDGWLHTGDAGEWVEGSHVRITDRLKDLLITSGGKNVAPSQIENALKTSPYVKEAMVLGDGKSYLTALIGIEYDTVGHWAQQRDLPYTTYRDLSTKPEVRDLIRGVVLDVNEQFARVEQVKDFRLLPKELDHEDGELTATQKVRRSVVGSMFGELVQSMYSRAGKK